MRARDSLSLSLSLSLSVLSRSLQSPARLPSPPPSCNLQFWMCYPAKALIVAPGGFGTCDELFELITLIQTGKESPIPIVLFGKEYWQSVINWDKFVEYGTVRVCSVYCWPNRIYPKTILKTQRFYLSISSPPPSHTHTHTHTHTRSRHETSLVCSSPTPSRRRWSTSRWESRPGRTSAMRVVLLLLRPPAPISQRRWRPSSLVMDHRASYPL